MNKPHAPTHANLHLPGGRAGLAATQRMPSVGFTGHLRGTNGNATQCFGTSHWRKTPPVSRADAALMGFEQAEKMGQRSLGDEYEAPAAREARQRAFAMGPLEC